MLRIINLAIIGNLLLFSDWFCQNIPITHINHCHLLDYEHQIISVVLSHCCYSLRVGEAHRVTYDYQALEKHILDKFVYGKPRIIPETLQVVYRKDIYTTMYFDAVRDQVSPQVSIPQDENMTDFMSTHYLPHNNHRKDWD